MIPFLLYDMLIFHSMAGDHSLKKMSNSDFRSKEANNYTCEPALAGDASGLAILYVCHTSQYCC